MEPVTPEDVTALFPDADEVSMVHLRLATLWAERELALHRAASSGLTVEQIGALRTAIAVKAMGMKTDLGGAGVLLQRATTPQSKAIEALEIPDEIKIKYRLPESSDHLLALSAEGLDRLAQWFLTLALPVRPTPGFFGASR